jgi:hypothetical protein
MPSSPLSGFSAPICRVLAPICRVIFGNPTIKIHVTTRQMGPIVGFVGFLG